MSEAVSRLLRRHEVQALTGLPVSTLYDYIAAGKFPSPVKLSVRSVAWRFEEVDNWIRSRPMARTTPAPVNA